MAALGVMDAVRDRGMRVATDMSIIGFDDVPIASSVTPPLTTIRQPLSEMGLLATQILVDLIQNPEEDQCSIILPTTLIIRGSTASPRS
jgi:LacI family transcriptional regulator